MAEKEKGEGDGDGKGKGGVGFTQHPIADPIDDVKKGIKVGEGLPKGMDIRQVKEDTA